MPLKPGLKTGEWDVGEWDNCMWDTYVEEATSIISSRARGRRRVEKEPLNKRLLLLANIVLIKNRKLKRKVKEET